MRKQEEISVNLFSHNFFNSKVIMEFNKEQNIIGIRVLSDNIIWLWRKNNSAVVVDPAISQPVIEFLKAYNLNL